MALCYLCKSIPFHDLPALPPHYNLPWNNTGVLLREDGKYNTHEEALEGWSYCYHQPSLESLKQSAEVCGLCDLILQSTSEVIGLLEKGPSSKYGGRVRSVPDYRLRLTKPLYGNIGFFVWTATNTADIILLAGVGLSVDDDDKLALSVLGRAIEQEPSSRKTLDRAAKWLSYCNAKHSRCETHNTPLPLRVLDVETLESPNIIYLRELPDARGRYFTLSHCWGLSPQFTTTRATIEERRKAIRVDELPKTFQDAVVITRHLGARYLWIDSLCICQDDREDWAVQSSKMADIYANSYLSIAALNAASDSVGCFTPRPARKYVPLDYVGKDGLAGKVDAFLLPVNKFLRLFDYTILKHELLSQRGWALQERSLAPRTLHFGANQMYFECNVEFRSEDGVCCYQGRYNSVQLQQQPDKTRHRNSFNLRGPTQWYSLVGDYGHRDLTHITDRLPALSGLAKVFESQLHDTYVAGLWRSHMIEGLCWSCNYVGAKRISPPRPYCGPSWSWVSMGSSCTPTLRTWGTDFATVVDVRVNLTGNNPYGGVLSAWLDIRAPLVQLELDTTPNAERGNPNLPQLWFKAVDGGQISECILLDEQMDKNWLEKLEVFALVLSRYDQEERESSYIAILITPVIGQKNEYRRLGIFDHLLKHTLGSCNWMKGDAELPIITLV